LDKVAQKEMANRIKARRESLGFTQESFCEVINLSVSSYTKIENAFQRPALNTLIKISQHLNLSLDYLVFGTDSKMPSKNIDAETLNTLFRSADNDKLLYASEFLARIAKIKDKL